MGCDLVLSEGHRSAWLQARAATRSPGVGDGRGRFFWRVASVLLNLLGLELTGILQGSLQILTHMLWIPLVEETFFRGYLGRALIRRWGFVSGVLLQAAAFALLPSHVSQGGWSMLSIFAFGLLAGWLMHRRDSIWAVWGAHAFANFLPLLAQAVW